MRTLRIHYFQHVSFEGIGYIEKWAEKNAYQLSSTKFYAGETIPNMDDIDWLIVMGGPMDPYQETEYSWLAAEKQFVKEAISVNKVVIGFCLGGQIISDALGGRVFRNREKEIGWLPVQFIDDMSDIPAFRNIEEFNMPVFHWHQDTFEIPQGGKRIASSVGCDNQAFVYNDRVFAFQYHFETEIESMYKLVENCPEDYVASGKFIQQPEEMFAKENIWRANHFLELLFDNIAALTSGKD